jgi:CO/xanthine dehydrogenase Mo-binding subunit
MAQTFLNTTVNSSSTTWNGSGTVYNVPETFTDPTKVIGNVPNLTDHFATRIVTGDWDYPGDILPGQKLFTGVQFCPYAHANVKTIDTSVAAKMPGVKAVITCLDIPSTASVAMVGKNSAGNYEVTYEGVIVAAVAATDPWLAHSAANAIKVTYDVLPFVTDMDAAMAPNAPAAVTGTTPNYRTTTAINKPSTPPATGPADVDAAMKTADVIIDNTDKTIWQGTGWATFFSHNTPEPREATVKWVGDNLWVWSGSQQITGHITNIANAMQMQESKVHFISHGMGGGYGDRKPNGEEAWIAALLSKQAAMPVNCMFSRHVNATGGATHQSQQKAIIKVGCKKDGTIAAIDAQWYGTTGTIALQLTYRTDYIRATGTPITTNVPRTGPFRSVNGMHSVFLSEQVMDQMAYQLSMDPFDFRMKVGVTPDRLDQATNTPNGSNALLACLQKCSDVFGWKAKFGRVVAAGGPGKATVSATDTRLYGVGCAYTFNEKGSSAAGRTVIVRVAQDGSVHVNLGIGAASGGTHTAEAVVVAEALGTTIDMVNVTVGETLLSGYGGSQAGSQGTMSNAYGAFEAAKKALGQMMTNAAKTLKTTTDQLTSSGGKIFLTSDPTKSVAHGSAVGSACLIASGDGTVIGNGLKRDYTPVPGVTFKAGASNTVRSSVAEMIELAVDQETGQIEVLNFVMVDDVGKVLFPKGVQSQLNGGAIMQFGFVNGWEQLFDPTTGATMNGNFIDQKNMTSADVPVEVMNLMPYESNNAASIYGGIGCGEPPDECYVAFHNAFYNATGKRINNTTISPAAVLKALGKI